MGRRGGRGEREEEGERGNNDVLALFKPAG